jgi:hypothetical protein
MIFRQGMVRATRRAVGIGLGLIVLDVGVNAGPVSAQTAPEPRATGVDLDAARRGYDTRAARKTESDRLRDQHLQKAVGSVCGGCGEQQGKSKR